MGWLHALGFLAITLAMNVVETNRAPWLEVERGVVAPSVTERPEQFPEYRPQPVEAPLDDGEDRLGRAGQVRERGWVEMQRAVIRLVSDELVRQHAELLSGATDARSRHPRFERPTPGPSRRPAVLSPRPQ